MAELRQKGELVIGTEGTYRPFSFHTDGTGELTGYDIAVATAVAEKLGVTPKFEESQWDSLIAGLSSGRFDIVANQVTMTPEREAAFTFSQPYTYSRGVIVTTVGNEEIESFADLSGKSTAQSLSSNWYTLAEDSGATIQPVEGWAQAVTLLKQGRVDATINDNLTFLDHQVTQRDDGIEIAATTDDVSKSGFLLREGSDDAQAAIDSALAELAADGTLAQISMRYFKTDVSQLST